MFHIITSMIWLSEGTMIFSMGLQYLPLYDNFYTLKMVYTVIRSYHHID